MNQTKYFQRNNGSILLSILILCQHLVSAQMLIQFRENGEALAIDISVIPHIVNMNEIKLFPHRKLVGCKLKQTTPVLWKESIETECDNFLGVIQPNYIKGMDTLCTSSSFCRNYGHKYKI
jgi:hypothetical protein